MSSIAFIDWQEFWSVDHKAEEWQCEPILPKGRQVSIFAPAKVGKSLLALDIALRLASGRRCFDRPAGNPIHVVYVDMEMAEGDLAERAEDMGYGPGDDLSHLHYALLPDLPPLDTPEGGEVLLADAQEVGAELVIIDTTSRVLSGAENDADSIRAFFHFTGSALKAAGITLLRLDHAGKDVTKGQRGSSAKNDDLDLVWMLTERDGGGFRLTATHRRQGWVPQFVDIVRLEEPTLRHELAQRTEPPGTKDLCDLLDRLGIPADWGGKKVRKALRDAGHGGRNDVIAAAISRRKREGYQPGTPSGTPSSGPMGTPNGDTPPNRFGDTLGDTSGHPFADKEGMSPSLRGDTLSLNRPAVSILEPCSSCGYRGEYIESLHCEVHGDEL